MFKYGISCTIIVLGLTIPEAFGIYGGSYADIKDFSYMVSVRQLGMHVCGGALITWRHAVTAARCINTYLPARAYDVHIGATQRLSRSGYFISVDKYHRYDDIAEKPNSNNIAKNDIAVLTLVSDAPFEEVFPLSFNRKEMDKLKNVKCVITGWGSNGQQKSPRSLTNKLKYLNVTFTDQTLCQNLLKKVWSLDETQICIKHNNILPSIGKVGASYGDTGAPLVCEGKLVGILSTWTSPRSPVPEIYTKIRSVATFIVSVLQETAGMKLPLMIKEGKSDEKNDKKGQNV